jgi:hypothetical protein
LRRRPDDVPVWRARLDWALASRRFADVRQSLAHLPVEQSTRAQIQRLTAWLAAFRGDRVAEGQALERLLAVDPTDSDARQRLVAIALAQGRADRAAQLRCDQTEIDRLKARYEKLNQRNQTLRDARELATLADRLGRRFEAKVFGTIAIATDGEEPRLRELVAQSRGDDATTHSPRATLAELLAAELDAAERPATH